jgi:regulator of replication initiation timing
VWQPKDYDALQHDYVNVVKYSRDVKQIRDLTNSLRKTTNRLLAEREELALTNSKIPRLEKEHTTMQEARDKAVQAEKAVLHVQKLQRDEA